VLFGEVDEGARGFEPRTFHSSGNSEGPTTAALALRQRIFLLFLFKFM
jgi:hypothetical protein